MFANEYISEYKGDVNEDKEGTFKPADIYYYTQGTIFVDCKETWSVTLTVPNKSHIT